MKKQLIKIRPVRTSILLGIVICCCSFAAKLMEPIKLNVESNHSTIQFSVPISNGITRMTGKFTDYAMEFEYDSLVFTNSKIALSINAASINTGHEERDEHLRTKDFFDVEKYPEITFVSRLITEAPNESYTLNGDFTMHGITKEIIIPIVPTGKDGKYTLGFSSTLSLLRSDFAVGTDFEHTSMDNFIGDKIDIEIYFWTKKWKEPKK